MTRSKSDWPILAHDIPKLNPVLCFRPQILTLFSSFNRYDLLEVSMNVFYFIMFTQALVPHSSLENSDNNTIILFVSKFSFIVEFFSKVNFPSAHDPQSPYQTKLMVSSRLSAALLFLHSSLIQTSQM